MKKTQKTLFFEKRRIPHRKASARFGGLRQLKNSVCPIRERLASFALRGGKLFGWLRNDLDFCACSRGVENGSTFLVQSQNARECRSALYVGGGNAEERLPDRAANSGVGKFLGLGQGRQA